MDEMEPPSKSQRKREAHALQKLATSLLKFSASDLQQADLPEDLKEALLLAQRIRAREAGRRQRQYIGRLMRGIDPSLLHNELRRLEGNSGAQAQHQRHIEQWRERILADATAVGEFSRHYPTADVKELLKLREQSLLERARGGPPSAYRALYKRLGVFAVSTISTDAP